MIYRLSFLVISAILLNSCMKEEPTSSNNVFSDLQQLSTVHDLYKESAIQHQRFKHELIDSLIGSYSSKYADLNIHNEGESFEKRSIKRISLGNGSTSVLLWSQMHGDEPTATMAIFDVLNFLMDSSNSDIASVRESILANLNIHFIPMLNPDGAHRFRRRNAQGIDMNRDALRLQTPEGLILKRVRDYLDAEYAFNLHDQSRYYRVGNSDKAATISFLAPAYNEEKEVNAERARAKRVIAYMNQLLQMEVPGHVGRYDDTFEPRAFGDNIAKWGSSTILIESGGYPNDPEKQKVRKLNFISIIAGLYAIATEDYTNSSIASYYDIPENSSKYLQLVLKGVQISPKENEAYSLDLGFQHREININEANDYYLRAYLEDVGDLSTWSAYQNIDASNLRFRNGKTYKETTSLMDWNTNSVLEKLAEGYLYFPIERPNEYQTKLPGIFYSTELNPANVEVHPGNNPSFYLVDDKEQIVYAIVNGFLIDMRNPAWPASANGLILAN